MKEKRRFPRKEKKIKSEVHSSDGMTYSTSMDLSNGGIFISTPEPVTIGSDIQLSIMNINGESIEIRGVVRWMNEDHTHGRRSGMGIEFVNMTEDDRTKIKMIIG